MAFEYKILFNAEDNATHDAFLDRLKGSVAKNNNESYLVNLEQDGFYFCDFVKTEHSSWILRRLIDHALSYTEKVVVQEL